MKNIINRKDLPIMLVPHYNKVRFSDNAEEINQSRLKGMIIVNNISEKLLPVLEAILNYTPKQKLNPEKQVVKRSSRGYIAPGDSY